MQDYPGAYIWQWAVINLAETDKIGSLNDNTVEAVICEIPRTRPALHNLMIYVELDFQRFSRAGFYHLWMPSRRAIEAATSINLTDTSANIFIQGYCAFGSAREQQGLGIYSESCPGWDATVSYYCRQQPSNSVV